MPGRRQSSVDLVQMNLGAPRLGILAVLPVHQEDPQSDPPEAAREGVQDAVYEASAIVGAESFGQVDGFLDDRDRRRLADTQLGGSEPKH